MDSIDWTEIQTLICVAKQGSLSAAARDLAVNHSTVLRRIQSFEQRHQVKIFQRSSQGYELSEQGRALLANFDRIDQDMLSLQRRISNFDGHLEGRLVVTTTDTLFDQFFQQPLFEFAKRHPTVTLDLLVSNELVDMNHLQADIAIRPAAGLSEGYSGAALLTLDFYLYVPANLAEQLKTEQSYKNLNWLGYSGALAEARAGQVLANQMSSEPVLTANTFTSLAAAANAGLGIALLPAFIGDELSNVRRLQATPMFSTDVYILVAEELASSAKVSALVDFLVAQYPAHKVS